MALDRYRVRFQGRVARIDVDTAKATIGADPTVLTDRHVCEAIRIEIAHSLDLGPEQAVEVLALD